MGLNISDNTNFMKLYLYLSMLFQTFVFAAKPHLVPKLTDLQKPWVFARANEASALFIEPHHKGSEPYAHIIRTDEKLQWFEFNGENSLIWDVIRFTETDKELTLYLQGGNKVLFTPYWDIDHCLLVIRFSPEEEINPTRFAIPYQFISSLPYQKAEE